MGHSIQALVVCGEVDEAKVRKFDVKIVPCIKGFTLIALNAWYTDHWAEKLNIHGQVAPFPICNSKVVHHIVNAISDDARFAIIMTDYFGGNGGQTAAVYENGKEIMEPATSSSGVINRALKLVGVRRGLLRDEFSTLGLTKYRSFEDLFEDY